MDTALKSVEEPATMDLYGSETEHSTEPNTVESLGHEKPVSPEAKTADSPEAKTADSPEAKTAGSPKPNTADSPEPNTAGLSAQQTADLSEPKTADSSVLKTGDSSEQETTDSSVPQIDDSPGPLTADSSGKQPADSRRQQTADSGDSQDQDSPDHLSSDSSGYPTAVFSSLNTPCTSGSKQTLCPVCNEDYKVPKILPCAHVLCRGCLVTWLRSDNPEPRSYCPVCRVVIVESQALAFTTCEEFADALHTDLSMEVLVHSVQTLRKEQVCCVCPRVTATYICLNCGDMLCGTCASGHRILSATRNHEIEDITAVTPERLAASRPAMCFTHPENTSDLFCPEHSVAVCHVCASSKHRACLEVKELDEKVDEARAMLGEMAALLRDGETALQEDIVLLDQELLQMDETAKASVKDIEETCDRLERSIKDCRQRLGFVIQSKLSDASLPVKTKKSTLSEQHGKISTHRGMIERVSTTTPRADIWNVAIMLQMCVHGLDVSVTLPNDSEVAPMKARKVNKKAVEEVETLLAELQMEETNDGKSGRDSESTRSDEGASAGGDLAETVAPLPARTNRLSLFRRNSNRQASFKPMFRFHANHSKNIALNIGRLTARRTGLGGIVLSSEPMRRDFLYEVRIDQTCGTSSCCMMVGVTFEDPAYATLPYTAAPGWASAIVAGPQAVWKQGVQEDSTLGQALQFLREGMRVGLMVDALGCLRLYVRGRDQGVIARDITQSCYAIFDMFNDSCKKITALPVQ